MPSMVAMISAILADEARMPSMVCTTSCMTRPPSVAISALWRARCDASCTCSVLLFTVEAISSIDAADSSRLAAAASVRRDKSMAPLAISVAVCTISSPERRTRQTMLRSASCILCSSTIRSAASSLPQGSGEVVRSPSVMARRWRRVSRRPPSITR